MSRTTQGILGGINIFQDILDNTFIFQDVVQDVLREFQRSPFIKGIATNWLTLLLPVLHDITSVVNSYE